MYSQAPGGSWILTYHTCLITRLVLRPVLPSDILIFLPTLHSHPAHILNRTFEKLLCPIVIQVLSKATSGALGEVGILGFGSRPGAGDGLAIY